ncbi:MAG: cytochrome c maturation protein CcmE [Nitrospiria bacterium]
MKKFYLRWGGILILGILITLFAGERYFAEVAVITPDQLGMENHSASLRLQGRIVPGSLKIDSALKEAVFDLSGVQKKIPVVLKGDDIENLREFKVVVLSGSWNPASGRFDSKKMTLTPNYGFITAAYLIGLIPLAFFLFNMERKVFLLYDTIKQEKLYQPEETL